MRSIILSIAILSTPCAAVAQSYGVGVGFLLSPSGQYVSGTFSAEKTPDCAENHRGPQPTGPFKMLETDKIPISDAIWIPMGEGWFCLSNATKGLSWR